MANHRILIISLAYAPFIGGAELAIENLTARLPDYQFDLLTVNLDGQQQPQEQLGNVAVYRLGRGRLAKYFFPWKAYKLAKILQEKNHYQAVWAMMANQAGLAAYFLKRRYPSLPYILTLQEGESEAEIWRKTWLIRPLYKKIYRAADCLVAISEFLAARARRLAPAAKIKIIPNGVAGINPERQPLVSNIVLSISRLVSKNGLADLLLAVKDLPVMVQLAGDGPQRNSLQKLASKLKIDNRVQFLGAIPNQEINGYLERAAVFVRPSHSEGLGTAFLEAQSQGVPVIGTAVGGIPEIIQDGQTGWLVPPYDPAALAARLAFVLDPANRQTVHAVAEQALREIQAKYLWDDLAAAYAKIFAGIYE
jgi:glycosyltransferase involved in cell wall biosynthesis